VIFHLDITWSVYNSYDTERVVAHTSYTSSEAKEKE
jgi:hypothetical protein